MGTRHTILAAGLLCLALAGSGWAAGFDDLSLHDQMALKDVLANTSSLQGGATYTAARVGQSRDALSNVINGVTVGTSPGRNYVPASKFQNFDAALDVVLKAVQKYHNAMNQELRSATGNSDIRDLNVIREGNTLFLPPGSSLMEIIQGADPRTVVARDMTDSENRDAVAKVAGEEAIDNYTRSRSGSENAPTPTPVATPWETASGTGTATQLASDGSAPTLLGATLTADQVAKIEEATKNQEEGNRSLWDSFKGLMSSIGDWFKGLSFTDPKTPEAKDTAEQPFDAGKLRDI